VVVAIEASCKPGVGIALEWDGASAYEVIGELGKGGMASVSLALQSGKSGFQKLVALKRPGAHLSQEPLQLAMFLDEARLAARLNHPNVVQTHSVGSWQGQPFIAMEFVEGQPLSRLRRVPELPLAVHLCVLADVLLGLHHAHELRDFGGAALNVVHRDVSPQNVLVSYDGLGKLVDFGIAKAHTQLTQTLAGCVKGKLSYMAPEQILGETPDRRTDLFAVGILLWEACARRALWPGMGARERINLLRGGLIPSVTELAPELPTGLDTICRRALAFEPHDRYQTAAELETELQALVATSDLVASRRDVASFMARHFAAQQQQTRQLIERKLGHLSIVAHAAIVQGASGAARDQAPTQPATAEHEPSQLEAPPEPQTGVRSSLVFQSPPQSQAEALLSPIAAPSSDAPLRPSIPAWGRSQPPSSARERKLLSPVVLGALAFVGVVGLGSLALALREAPRRAVQSGATASPPAAATLAHPEDASVAQPKPLTSSASEAAVARSAHSAQPKPLRRQPAPSSTPVTSTPSGAFPLSNVSDFGGRR
jgi:serine/threonine protein kinase